MFNLNKNISEWKQSFYNRESFTSENIEELESHLNDQMEILKGSGLTEEEAFWIAQNRIGNSKALSIEYEKVNSGIILKQKFSIMLLGFLFFSLLESPGYLIRIISPVMSDLFKIDLIAWTYVQYTSYLILMILLFSIMFWFVLRNNTFIEKFIIRNKSLLTGLIKKAFVFIYIPFVVFYCFMYIYGTKWMNSAFLRIENQSIHRLDYLNLTQVFGFFLVLTASVLFILLVIVSFRKKSKSSLVLG